MSDQRDDGQPIWSIGHVDWWSARELLGDERFRAVDGGGYRDHVAVLSGVEARELCERYRQRGVMMDADEVRLLDQRLALKPPGSCWVVVIVYEWESGL